MQTNLKWTEIYEYEFSVLSPTLLKIANTNGEFYWALHIDSFMALAALPPYRNTVKRNKI